MNDKNLSKLYEEILNCIQEKKLSIANLKIVLKETRNLLSILEGYYEPKKFPVTVCRDSHGNLVPCDEMVLDILQIARNHNTTIQELLNCLDILEQKYGYYLYV